MKTEKKNEKDLLSPRQEPQDWKMYLIDISERITITKLPSVEEQLKSNMFNTFLISDTEIQELHNRLVAQGLLEPATPTQQPDNNIQANADKLATEKVIEKEQPSEPPQ